jgi:hypothetical protein
LKFEAGIINRIEIAFFEGTTEQIVTHQMLRKPSSRRGRVKMLNMDDMAVQQELR